MSPSLKVSPRHRSKRMTLNVIAIVLLAVGIPLIISGFTQQSQGHKVWSDHVTGRDVGDQRPFWERGSTFEEERARSADAWERAESSSSGSFVKIALGMILTAGGMGLLWFANMGVVARYAAGELAPVARDAAHDVAPGVQVIAGAMVDGLRRGEDGGEAKPDAEGRLQHPCGTWNDPDDRFCKGCGQTLGSPVCPACSKENDADARFCDSCGHALS